MIHRSLSDIVAQDLQVYDNSMPIYLNGERLLALAFNLIFLIGMLLIFSFLPLWLNLHIFVTGFWLIVVILNLLFNIGLVSLTFFNTIPRAYIVHRAINYSFLLTLALLVIFLIHVILLWYILWIVTFIVVFSILSFILGLLLGLIRG